MNRPRESALQQQNQVPPPPLVELERGFQLPQEQARSILDLVGWNMPLARRVAEVRAEELLA